jgi:parvulin-like peptidyl-prolyl isomerase
VLAEAQVGVDADHRGVAGGVVGLDDARAGHAVQQLDQHVQLEQLAQRLVSTIDDEEYFKALMQEQQKVRSEEKLETMLAEGLATESSALSEKDWQHARAELENRITQNK